MRQIVTIKPDKLASIQDDIGPLAIEDFMVAFAELLRDS